MAACISQLTVYRLAIPMRQRFTHAAARRQLAEPIIVQAELSDGTIGYGETHPRPYVTGETSESVVTAIKTCLVPHLLELRPASFPAALEAISELPFADAAGACIAAARAAVELALLDAYSRHFRRSIDEAAGWLGLANFGSPGSAKHLRYSGLLSGDEPSQVLRALRRQRLFGLRDFKLKVGTHHDEQTVQAVVSALAGRLARQRATLRLDANGAWSFDQALERLTRWADLPIVCIEQPLPPAENPRLPELRQRSRCRLMADESLVTYRQAEQLIQTQAVDFFNIRISKNGGLLAAMKLAGLARKHGIGYQLGCMVGETSILSAAGRRLLQLVPQVSFAEGSFGRFLLSDDVVARPMRFKYGGRFRRVAGPGWAVQVQPHKLRQLCADRPIALPF